MATLPLTNPDVAATRQAGLCQFLHMKEENIRFVLLAVLLFLYLAVGAFIFQAAEEPAEKKIRDDFVTLYKQFVHNLTGLHSLAFGVDPENNDDSHNHNQFSTALSTGEQVLPVSEPSNGNSNGVIDNFIADNINNNSNNNKSFKGGVTNNVASYSVNNNNNISHNASVLRNSNSNSNRHRVAAGKSTSSSSSPTSSYPLFQQPPSIENLHELLFAYGNATQAGVIWKRRRWDYVGSFHFTWTIVSTIGYGATTPTTTLGKLFVIPYGFFGCAGGLLFFNLFLERIITFLASCMRTYRIQRQKRRPFIYGGGEAGVWGGGNAGGSGGGGGADASARSGSNGGGAKSANKVTVAAAAAAASGRRGASPAHSSTGEGSVIDEPDWKPSVYWVMLCLFVMSAIVIFGSAYMFQQMENWTFWDGVYFSFVSYATIGFGDLVSLQEKFYGPFEVMYRLIAFAIMIFGCCCIYSLLNVTSIVIKQVLNWLIQKIHYCECCRCCCVYCQCSAATMKRRFSTKKRRSTRRPRRGDASHLNRSNFQIAVLKVGSHAQNVKIFNDNSGRNEDHLKDDDMTPDVSPNLRRAAGAGGGLHGGIHFDLDERRCSGENMISIRGELSNKVSLAVMQKRLYETAQMSRNVGSYDTSFSATSVGPLAIVTEKLGDNHG